MEDRKSLSRWRLEKAGQCLSTAVDNLTNNDYCSAVNRSYYCVFHCIRSIFALEGIDFKKHSAVIAYFRENYIKSGIFEKRMSDIVGSLFTLRSECDYDDYFIIGKEEVRTQVKSAEYFLKQVKVYLED